MGMFSLTWHGRIANLSIHRDSFYKFARYVEIVSTSTPFCVDFIDMCHVNGINICCHDSCHCHERRNEWY